MKTIEPSEEIKQDLAKAAAEPPAQPQAPPEPAVKDSIPSEPPAYEAPVSLAPDQTNVSSVYPNAGTPATPAEKRSVVLAANKPVAFQNIPLLALAIGSIAFMLWELHVFLLHPDLWLSIWKFLNLKGIIELAARLITISLGLGLLFSKKLSTVSSMLWFGFFLQLVIIAVWISIYINLRALGSFWEILGIYFFIEVVLCGLFYYVIRQVQKIE